MARKSATPVAPIVVGDRVLLWGESYIRGTRGPGFRGRFRKYRIGYGVLMSKFDPAAHEGTVPGTWTEEQLRVHFASHVGLINATGSALGGDLTEKNNPVRLDSGRIIFADAGLIERA